MDPAQTIFTSDGNFEKATDLDIDTLNGIIKACTDGSVNELETILNSIEPDKLSHYLNAFSSYMQVAALSRGLFSRINGNMHPLYFTPLMVASIYGHESIVRFLLENHSHYCIIDAQNYFTSYGIHCGYYEERFTKQTALWLAVEYEHLDVVQTLISLGKANVNHKADYGYSSDSNWTPLGVACKNRQLEMVKLLIENGANLYDVDINNSTCLMIACQYKNYEIVKYLLSLNDCDDLLNATNSQGSTALHMLSFSSYPSRLKLGKFRSQDQSISIVNFLFEECKIKIVKDNDGYTPLAKAATGDNEKLTKYFIENAKEPWYTIPQIIDDFEIIGSYFLMKGYLQEGYHYLLKAMTLRYNYGKAPILKTNLLSPNKAYEFCKECQTIKELKSIENKKDRLLIEAFMIQERLGITSFLSKLDDYARQYSYWRCVQLSFYAYQLRLKAQIDLDKRLSNLKNCVDAINKIIDNKRWKPTKFDLFMKILEATENEFIENRNSRSMYQFIESFSKFAWSLYKHPDFEVYSADKCLYIILNLLFIGIKILPYSDKNAQKHRRILHQQVKKFISSDYRTIGDKKTLLHLSLLSYHNHSDTDIVTSFPSLPVVELLLSCRAPINAIDSYYNTPLHELAKYGCQIYIDDDDIDEDFHDVEKIFKLLINAGAHRDAVGQYGLPENDAPNKKIKDLLQMHPIEISLKCICAKMIQKNNLNYTNHIPESLHSFIQLHLIIHFRL